MFCAACYFLCWRLWVRLLLPKCLCEIISESYICIIYNLSDNQNIQRSANDYTKFSNTVLQHNIITQQSAIHYFDRVLHASCDVRTSSSLLSEIIGEVQTLLHETKVRIVRSSPTEMQCLHMFLEMVFGPQENVNFKKFHSDFKLVQKGPWYSGLLGNWWNSYGYWCGEIVWMLGFSSCPGGCLVISVLYNL